MITHQDIPIFVRETQFGNVAKPEPRSVHIVREPTATKEKLRVERAQSHKMRCAKLADKFRTGRPSDVIQYGIDPSGYLVKVLAP